MTALLIEGFDHMDSVAKLAAKGWSAATSGSSFSTSMVTGRYGQFAVRLQANSNVSGGNTNISKPFTANATVHVGFGFRFSSLPSATARVCVLIAGGSGNCRININSIGKIEIRNSGGTLLATGTQTLIANRWYFIEAKAFQNGASGTIEVHIDGAVDIASTTVNIGSANWDTLQFIRENAASATYTGTFDYDDVYVFSTGGSTNNGFVGDVRVETLYPTADGNYSAWTPNSGSTHFNRVNEASGTYPDDDTTYNSDATPGDRDSYAFGNLSPATGTVLAVQYNVYARKDDAGTRTVCAFARISGTDYDGSSLNVTSSYGDLTEILEASPASAVAWTFSEINGAEFGVKVVA